MTDDQYRREYAHHLIEQFNKGQMTRRQLLVRASIFGFSATAAGSLLAACGGSTSSSPAASGSGAPDVVKGGTLKVAVKPSITNLDPVTIYDMGGITLIAQFCEYLVSMNEDLTLSGVLAESWSPNVKGDVWTFKLRQGVTFNDGSPFEADDVVATMDLLVDPKSGSAAQAALVGILSPGGTQKVDQYTVAFNLDRPFADFPYMVCSSSYNTVMLKRDYAGDWVKNPIGTGPWLLKKYVPKQSCTAVKNPTYWRKDASGNPLPYMDSVEWVMIGDESASTLQLQSGAVDVQGETVYQGSQALYGDPNIKVWEFPTTGMREVAMNVTKDPFGDKRVRQAIGLCMDRVALNQALYNGKATIGNDTVFASIYPNAPKIPDRVQDYAKAKQLLADAGHADGLTITLTTEKHLEVPQYAQLIKAQCEPAGIKVNVDLISYDEYFSGKGKNQVWLSVPMGITQWGARPTPGVFITAMLLPDSAWTSSHWNNAEFVSLYSEYMSTVDEAKRLELATKMATIEQDETPTLQTAWITELRAMKKNVYGVRGPGGFYCDVAEAYKA